MNIQNFNHNSHNHDGAQNVTRHTTEQTMVIRMPQLIKMLGLSRAAIYQRLQPSSPYYDETFPKRVRLGQKSVGWRLSDVQEYINNLESVEA